MSANNLDSKLQSQEVYLDSQYASVNSSSGKNSDLYFFLKTPIIVGNDHDVVLRVDNFVCPVSFYIVNDTNNTLVTSLGTYTITRGNYNALTLRTELDNITPFTISYSSSSGKLSFTYMTNFTFQATSTCFSILGFKEGSARTSTDSSLTGDYPVNLSGTSLVYIDIPNLTTRNISSKNEGGFTTIIKSVVCDVPYGSILSYVNNTNAAVVLGEKYISYIYVRLLDDNYSLLDLNGQHFTLTLEIFYYFNGKPSEYTGNLQEAVRQQEDIKKSLLQSKGA